MPAFFAERGYATASVGKTHFGYFPSGQRVRHGFQRLVNYEGLPNDTDDYVRWFDSKLPGEDPLKSGGITCKNQSGRIIGKKDWCWNSWLGTTYEFEEKLHPTVWTAEEALKMIENLSSETKPWLLSVGFHRPHSPYDPPKRFFDQVAARAPHISSDGWDLPYRDCRTKGLLDSMCGEVSASQLNTSSRAYQALVLQMDSEIGRILDRVQGTNTFIVFLSDHGDMQMDHYMWRKSVPYEGSAHIPMILAWPDVAKDYFVAGPQADAIVELRDVFPTLARLAGLEGVAELLSETDGLDLSCHFRVDKTSMSTCGRAFLDLEHAAPGGAPQYHWNAFVGEHEKYIYFATGVEQLFNLTADPRELQNLARMPAYATRLNYWRSKLVDMFQAEQRGASFVEKGILVPNRKPVLYSPHYPRAGAVSAE